MTRSMSRWMLAGIMALVALGAVGAPAQADPPANPFAGSWSGTWSIEDGPIGTYAWTISSAGQISGTVYSITANHAGAVVGHVGADGNLSFTGMAPGDDPSEDGNGFSFKGTALSLSDDMFAVSAALHLSRGGTWSLVAILERN